MTNYKTREEHIKWCKERAIFELDHSGPIEAITSMMSDLGKHHETNSEGLKMLCLMQMRNRNQSRQAVIDFINGFN